MTVAIKFALIVFITTWVKKPSFTNASSQCLYCNAEQYFEHFLEEKNLYLTTSIWNICRGNCARLPPKSLLQILLILAGDVELCPGPRVRCSECTKCFRRNTDKTLCSVCSRVFHSRCLNADVCRPCSANGVHGTRSEGQDVREEEYRMPELESLLNTRGFKILHQNIKGLFGKKDIISHILGINTINIFSVSETFTTIDTPACWFDIAGYAYEQKCRPCGTGGGIGVYIRNGTPYIRRFDLESENLECIWLEICFPHTKGLLIGIIYRPPNTSNYLQDDFNFLWEENLGIVLAENKEIIVTGDINSDYLKRNDNIALKEIFSSNGFSQLVSKATRITEHGKTLIDVIQSTHPRTIATVEVIPAGLSDHDMIGCVRKLNHQRFPSKLIKCRNYSRYCPNDICSELSEPTQWKTYIIIVIQIGLGFQ